MNVTIQQTPQHVTFDGLMATYCIARDALTGRRAAMFQVVQLGEGIVQFRTMDRRSMPPDFGFSDALKLAMVYETQRGAQRPPKPRQPEPIRPNHSILRHIRPMHLPADRGFRSLPSNTRPMRRLLCHKLAARHAMKGAA